MKTITFLSSLLLTISLGAQTKTIDLKASPAIKLVGVKIENETYKGKSSLRVKQIR